MRRLQCINRQLRATNRRLETLAMIDPITGLPNRRSLLAALDRELVRTDRYHHPCTVLFLDLDCFKSVNDNYGHAVGDTVLQGFSGVVRSAIRESDILGRWGGDEFMVILPETKETGAQRITERISTALAGQHFITRSEFYLTCSIGFAVYPFDAQERDLLIIMADQAMYAVKCRVHNTLQEIATVI